MKNLWVSGQGSDTGSTAVAPNTCHWCGYYHTTDGLCPRIKEIEYHPNGTIKRVVLHGE